MGKNRPTLPEANNNGKVQALSPASTQVIDLSATGTVVTAGLALTTGVAVVEIYADTPVHIGISSAPTPTTSGVPVASHSPRVYAVKPDGSQKVAGITQTNASTGKIWVTELT